jgi:chaperone protein EcpD
MKTCPRWAIALITLVFGSPSFVGAGVIVSGTRHVYPEKQREISIQVTNDDSGTPRLIQTWLDRGQPAELSDVPFSLSPPVFRIDAGKSQVIRLIYTREPLPADRESLFWLNVLEVPPTMTTDDAEATHNYLSFAFRIRTKVFFRPAHLPGKPEEAVSLLRWSLQRGPQGAQLHVINPSAYHVTLNEVALAMGPDASAPLLTGEAGMIVPGGSLTLAVNHKATLTIPANAQVQFKYINDYGAFSTPQRAPLHF